MINMCFLPLLFLIASAFGERPNLKESDVVFMYSAEPSLYEAYSGTVVGWAGRARSKNQVDISAFRKRVEEAHIRGLRYCGSVDFVVDFGGFIDFCPDRFIDSVCRDLEGNPITVPWLWDHKHKGHPAYWFCTNSPDFQAYLLDQVERACLAPIDGLHIDDWRGTYACASWFGGCFCKHCREGFRNWLKERFSGESLKERGIEDIESFDIQAFYKAKGISAERWRRENTKLPLGDLFVEFQKEKMLEVVRGVFEYAERLRGKPLLRSVNSSASTPESLIVAPLVDYFCGEMEHSATTSQVPLEPAFVFRLLEGLGKPQAATAGGYDWAWIAEKEKPGLVRTWIAQAYAFGSTFMVPHHQWCYTQEKGTHWWRGKTEDFASIYRFIRQNSVLFDGYCSLSDIALLYTNEDYPLIHSAGLELLKANIPFTMLIAEPELGKEPSAEVLSAYKIIIAGKLTSAEKWEKIVNKQKGKLVVWNGLEDIPESYRRQVLIKGSEKIRVSLRYKPGSKDAPIVCHLLNQDYDLEKDDVRPADVEVSISLSLLERVLKERGEEAILYQPASEPQKIKIEISEGRVRFRIKGLGLLAIAAIGKK